jgi:antitoxin VapB
MRALTLNCTSGLISTDEVFIRKEGDDLILSPRPRDWNAYLESAPVASDAFLNEVEDLPVQERAR